MAEEGYSEFENRYFTADQAAEIALLSKRQISEWHKRGFFIPDLSFQDNYPQNRIYSFKNVVGLKIIFKLKAEFKVHFEELKKASGWLRERELNYWADQSIYVIKKQIHFETSGSIENTDGQMAFIDLVDAISDVANKIRQIGERQEEDYGVIARNKFVMGNESVFSKTRIPVRVVIGFLEAGADIAAILSQYPVLRPKDIEAARDQLSYSQK